MKEKDFDIYEMEMDEAITYIPSNLQKWGLIIIAVFIFGLLSIAYLIKYPEALSGKITIPASEIKEKPKGYLLLSATNIGALKTGLPVLVFTDNYPETTYGYLKGKIEKINGVPLQSGLYCINISFPKGLITNKGFLLSNKMLLSGSAEIILQEQRLIHSLINSVSSLIK